MRRTCVSECFVRASAFIPIGIFYVCSFVSHVSMCLYTWNNVRNRFPSLGICCTPLPLISNMTSKSAWFYFHFTKSTFFIPLGPVRYLWPNKWIIVSAPLQLPVVECLPAANGSCSASASWVRDCLLAWWPSRRLVVYCLLLFLLA